jgi:hypothetical protein
MIRADFLVGANLDSGDTTGAFVLASAASANAKSRLRVKSTVLTVSFGTLQNPRFRDVDGDFRGFPYVRCRNLPLSNW